MLEQYGIRVTTFVGALIAAATAITRGVNCALANSTTIIIDETTKTPNVSIDAVNAPCIW